ncbi:WhiB family transcriptional regulator [Streptomyces sp. NBC_00829]|uniref:WhiB family transcriptional regulator n=1 Tax=Streptomyces sp. NBC_00829 TaxID=2903679 RepID=UPI00386D617F|nr:WhiB family transcriptional regulator [Streptomyces sp. NBC_00829]
MTTRAPDTLEPADTWRSDGLCGKPQYKDQRDLWFPHTTDRAAATAAKKICNVCPAMETCATWALTHRVESGIWGGLDEAERRRIHRRKVQLDDAEQLAQAAVEATLESALQKALARHTRPGTFGHTVWTTRSTSVAVRGVAYTPMRLAFYVHYGRPAEGTVRAACGLLGCVTGEHLLDGRLRRLRQGGLP